MVETVANLSAEFIVTIVAGLVFVSTATVIAFRSGPRR
jgi:hypothetical protein